MQEEVTGRGLLLNTTRFLEEGPSHSRLSREVEEEPRATWRAGREGQGKVGCVLKAQLSAGQSPRAKAGTV